MPVLVKRSGPLHGNWVYSSPTVVNGVVYVGSYDFNVYAIDASTGQKKWAFPTGGYVQSSPKVVNGVVYVGSGDSSVYAIDASTGQKKWVFPTGGSVYSSPMVMDRWYMWGLMTLMCMR